ncbi:MAG TPA: hypothetical protein DCM68_03665, partial [Verrucomicrobia bacterium]|nr:hypothetical protein [Verrucomicrobiota bacterium]
PTLKTHTIRLAVATAIGIVLMFSLLMLAVKYLQRDWNQKQQRARASEVKPASEKTAPPDSIPAGWTYELRPSATQRQMDRLTSDPLIANPWLVFARGLSDKADPQAVLAGLRMAMAIGGENAEIKNDLGAAYLRQKRTRDAAAQFCAARQIAPGFTPALFNLALCSIADRNPSQAVRRLGKYLGHRPDDVAALRLQSTLLTQLGQPRDALDMLEKFLKDQPPEQPLFLEAAILAARLGQSRSALRYMEIALNGNPIQSVVRTYQSPVFRDIRLSGEGDALAARMAAKARTAFGAPLPVQEIEPLLAPAPDAKIR